jgi:hypothetical protein
MPLANLPREIPLFERRILQKAYLANNIPQLPGLMVSWA